MKILRNKVRGGPTPPERPYRMSEALLTTHLDYPLLAQGKVRDIYTAPSGDLLFIATDRISAFDHVLASGIPGKGRILTQLSLFWFHFLQDLVPNHLITATPAGLPPELPAEFQGRTMLVRRARMFPVECVVRGYLSGSGWLDYQRTQSICGIPLPAGLRESDRLPQPIFTPAAKINTGGHDENISFAQTIATIGQTNAERLRDLSLALYAKASAHAATAGVILADTKFEFGLIPDSQGQPQIALCDEVLTPDSSRYWPADQYRPGGPTPSFDKQYVRDYLESIHWNKQAPAPALTQEVIANTRAKYMQAFTLITGRPALQDPDL